MRSGHASGMAQRRKKMERKMGIDMVCQRTASVWRRRRTGTFRGAQRTLQQVVQSVNCPVTFITQILATKPFLVMSLIQIGGVLPMACLSRQRSGGWVR